MSNLVILSCFSYITIALFFLIFRCVKIVDLYREYQIVRAREQKVHIKSHAQMLYSEIKTDLMWPVVMFRGLKNSLSWMKEK